MRRVAVPIVLSLVALALVVPGSASANTHVYERVLVPMRDGVKLSVDLWRPNVPAGRRVPVILSMTPYHVLYRALDRREDDLFMAVSGAIAERFVPLGYAYAQADVRGTYNSGGCWDYGGLKERQDGYDLVEWLGGVMVDGSPSPAAAWSNGRVAMIGASYDGTTANAAAVEQPPHLATIVPVAAISRWWGYAYQQGARALYSGESLDIDPPSDTPADFDLAYGFLPPPDRVDNATEVAMRWTPCDRAEHVMRGYDLEPDYDAFWVERDYLRLASRVTVPALVVHGLRDFNVKTWEGTAWFQALPGEKILVLGQWGHAWPNAYPGWRNLILRWFERWLYDVPNGVEHEPAVRVQSSDGQWREQETWGDRPVVSYPLAGEPFTYVDDGALTESEMLRGFGDGTRFVRVPVPETTGIAIEGRPVLHLRASSSLPSTQFVAVLCDVGPDGSCDPISRAFLNARYRNGLEQGEDLTPGRVETLRLEFIDKDHRLATDHHLELILASSSTTWVVPDDARAQNTLLLAESRLDVPQR